MPDYILHKPGRLTEEEFAIVKRHTTAGYEILASSERKILNAAAKVALEHHERFDGKGYPNGRKGEVINIYGRITAVADVFDALSSTRSYKGEWAREKVHDHFTHARGTAFDPALVDIFLREEDVFYDIRTTYQDACCVNA